MFYADKYITQCFFFKLKHGFVRDAPLKIEQLSPKTGQETSVSWQIPGRQNQWSTVLPPAADILIRQCAGNLDHGEIIGFQSKIDLSVFDLKLPAALAVNGFEFAVELEFGQFDREIAVAELDIADQQQIAFPTGDLAADIGVKLLDMLVVTDFDIFIGTLEHFVFPVGREKWCHSIYLKEMV